MILYKYGYCSEIGIKKSVNQDSLCIKNARLNNHDVLMAVVCDGMGGLSKGELASASVIRAFSKWFETEMSNGVLSNNNIRAQWEQLIIRANNKLWEYGNENGISLGTTLTVILLIDKKEYVIAHVGDSRAYKISGKKIEQITEDQSYVAREVKRGNITKEQANIYPGRNVLLQCIGASRTVEPEFYNGKIDNEGFLLCSDGFRHVVNETEIVEELGKSTINCEKTDINLALRKLVDLNMQRGETDNITAIYIV